MFKTILLCGLCLVSAMSFARGFTSHSTYYSGGTGSHYVGGYTRSNGTYVSGYRQTNRNATQYDNWSSKGNVNPYTGKRGTINPSR